MSKTIKWEDLPSEIHVRMLDCQKEQDKKLFSEEDVQNLIKIIKWYDKESDVRPNYDEKIGDLTMWEWFEKFKKNNYDLSSK